ncbi:leucine-rich repeat-containing protein 18 [Brienomyrus brachyistius]|uniref:leucine-rich repeat-containing protein 18 n=1 Tax=Brienomyrus brachyistius TaxID=42636 RepID=UPI0020B3A382|nr:leucine-rich repeat-containing protein 18 [Brienomyrus brachyistius]
MAKGKKKAASKGKKITLKMAKNQLRLTADGKRRLDLSNMKIDAFPKCLLKMADVDELDLSRNVLRTIPDYIDRFLNLRYLDLHSNRIEQLPEALGRLQTLRHLNLCNNRLTATGIPSQLGRLSSLRSLNLGMNRLETLPACIGALRDLQELGLFDNLLTSVPSAIRGLPSLRKLNTLRNPLAASTEARREGPTDSVEHLYLVREDSLCKLCLGKCREDRQKISKQAQVPCRRTAFSGLVVPNSTAQESQVLWR